MMSRRLGEREGGNREVSPTAFFDVCGDRSGADVEANSPKEGPTGETWFPPCDRAGGEGEGGLTA
jgi:hypothetical protein